MRLALWIVCLCLLMSGLSVGAQTALAQGTCLLSASAAGAYGVRYHPDRALLHTTASVGATVTVHLPEPPKWAYLDDQKLPVAQVKWDAENKCATVELPAGSHTVTLGWAGAGELPARGQKIPVLLEGKQVAALDCDFGLDAMKAQGGLQTPLGRAALRLKLAGELPKDAVTVLAVGDTVVEQWRPERDYLAARGKFLVGPATRLSLTVKSYALLRSPVAAVELERLEQPAEPKKVAEMPAAGILIEAEDYVKEGGPGQAEVAEGKHADSHGGKTVFQNSGDGHWLEWSFKVEKTGVYDLYVRAATQEPQSLRTIQIDGRPAQGLDLMRFPGTGGWGYDKSEWWALQVAGQSEAAPPIKLEAGDHALRMIGESPEHLNLDYMVLVPHP